MLGLHRCVDFSLVAVSGVYSPVVTHKLLTAVVSPVAEPGLEGTQASEVKGHGLGVEGSRAQVQ